jgi:hypothetical protein
MIHRKIRDGFLVLITSLALATDASAGFIWSMNDNAGNSVNLTDGGTGQINFNGNVGEFSVTGHAVSKPYVGGPRSGLLHFTQLVVTTSSAVPAPLTIRLSDTDFPSTSASIDKGYWKGLISNGSVTGDVYFDPANIDFGTGGLHIPLGTFTAPPNPTSFAYDSGFIPFVYGSVPYSILINLEIQATGPLLLSFTEGPGGVQAPEPSTAFIAGIGIVVLGARLVVRRSRCPAAQ